jgi:hypothetical protein
MNPPRPGLNLARGAGLQRAWSASVTGKGWGLRGGDWPHQVQAFTDLNVTERGAKPQHSV